MQRLAGISDADATEWPEGVFPRFAAWDYNLEEYVRARAQDKFDGIKAAVASEYHIDEDICLKFPASASEVLRRLTEAGVTFPELKDIIEKIDSLAN